MGIMLALGVGGVAACGSGGVHAVEASDISARTTFTNIPDGPVPLRFGTGVARLDHSPKSDPGAGFRISHGLMTATPTGEGPAAAYYTSADLHRHLTTIGAEWVFGADRAAEGRPGRGSGADGAVALFISRNGLAKPYSMNLVISPDRWSLGVWPVGGRYTILQWKPFEKPLAEDGSTVYHVEARVNGSLVDVQLPDGNIVTITDGRVAQWAGDYASFEVYSAPGAAATMPGFTQVWASTSS